MEIGRSGKRTGLLTEKPSESALYPGWAALIATTARKRVCSGHPKVGGQPSVGQGPWLVCRGSLEGKAWGLKAGWSFLPLLCPDVISSYIIQRPPTYL